MDIHKVAAWANIGNFIIAVYLLWRGQQSSTSWGSIMSHGLAILTVGIIVAACLNISALWMAYRTSGRSKGNGRHPSTPMPLREKVLRLGQDLFAFLREAGPEPEDPANHYQSADDVWKRIREGRTPYENKVHHGYMSRFKDRVLSLYHELEAESIDPQIMEEDLDPRGMIEPKTVKKIAAHMFLTAANMDIKEASKGT
jgi:hypothetical protein